MKYLGLILAFVGVILFSLPEESDARRLGGSRSFGGKSSFSSPAPKAQAPVGGTAGTNSTLRNDTSAGATGAGAATAGAGAATRSGFGGGMGLFGGLLAGTFLGSMLMGTPFAGGGMFDLLLIGLLVFFGIRLMRTLAGRKNNEENPYQNMRVQQNTQRSSSSQWDTLRDDNQSNARASYSQAQESTPSNALNIDTNEFIEGAKTAYVRLQESWDKRDLDDIKIFTTKAVYDEIQSQAKEDSAPSKTEILTVNAQINAMERDSDGERISVYFTVLLREDAEGAAENVTELWHFIRHDSNSMWRVDGIQQVN